MLPKYPNESLLYAEQPDMVDERDAVAGIQITYVGFCDSSTKGTNEPKWRIKRYMATMQAGSVITETKFAEGSIMYNKIWDNRENYNYKFKI